MIVRVTQDAVEFAVILAVRIRGEKLFPFADHLVVFVLYKVYLRDVI